METLINPYTFLGTRHKEALSAIITNLPPDPTYEQLKEQLMEALFSPDPEFPLPANLVGEFAGAILPLAYNGYVNARKGAYLSYTEAQMPFVDAILDGICHVNPLELSEYLTDVEESIGQSALGYGEQTPLLAAIAIGKAATEYWMEQYLNPGLWVNYLDTHLAVNYTLLPDLLSATMRGALLTYGIMQQPRIQPLDLYTAVIGSTGLAAGKVLFGWRERR